MTAPFLRVFSAKGKNRKLVSARIVALGRCYQIFEKKKEGFNLILIFADIMKSG